MNTHSRRPRIWFVNRFFFPDESATAQILSDVVFGLAEHELDISVITSRLNYAGRSQFSPFELLSSVPVRRIATTSFGRSNLIGRTLDYLSFYLSAFFSVLKNVRQGDICVVKTDPPLLSIPLAVALRWKRARLINWLLDVYPDVAAELGISFAKGRIGAILKGLRNRSWKRAEVNVVIGSKMATLLKRAGVPDHKITTIQNFSDDDQITPLEFGASPLRSQWGYDPSEFLVVYSGNLGRAHDYHTVLDAARLLKDATHIKFLFIGGGKLRDLLEMELKASPLASVQFQPYQPRDMLSQSLGAADLHWLSLRPELEGLIVPSKLYGIAAAGRGALFIGDVDGEAARLMKTTNWGVTINSGDAQACAETLRALSRDTDKLKQLGQNARRFIDESASKRLALNAWRKLIERLL